MSLKTSPFVPSKHLLEALRPTRRRPTCDCIHAHPRKSIRHVSSTTSHPSEMEVTHDGSPRPRWSHTPAAMKAPFRSHPEEPSYKQIQTNNDPKKLDAVYVRFLGPGGDQLLSDETKWLAVTHKSFDHGRRGFNDRLAFMGKRILELQTSLALLSTGKRINNDIPPDPHARFRKPFQHPSLDGVEALLGGAAAYFLHHKAISTLAAGYGIPEIVRWWPKKPDSLNASGCDMVYTQAVLAIIGGIALEQGGAMANRIAKDRVLIPMGFKPAAAGIKGNMDGMI